MHGGYDDCHVSAATEHLHEDSQLRVAAVAVEMAKAMAQHLAVASK